MTQARIAAHRQRPDGPSRFRSRRGAISVAFAVGSTALLGMGALATEAGIWLSSRRNAQNAADVAAYAGAVRLSLNGDTDARDAAGQVVGRNGFTDTGALTAAGDTRVTIDIGFVTPATLAGGAVGNFVTPAPAGSSANAIRVQIQQVQRIGLSQLINRTAPIAWGGAVAAIEAGGPACTLSIPPPGTSRTDQINGQTNIEGNTTVIAERCLIASNYKGAKSINLQGDARNNLRVAGLRASGQCYNCEDPTSTQVPGGYVSGASPIEDPYKYLNQWPMPNFNNSQCADPIYLDSTGARTNQRNRASTIFLTARNDHRIYTSTQGGYVVSRSTDVAVCVDPNLQSGETLRLYPGTYFFNDASLTMQGGTITCEQCTPGGPGVTLVFTGSNANNVGTLRVEGGTFTLIAPGPYEASPSVFAGTVIYRDDLGRTGNNPQYNIKITGNPGSTLFGAVYVPTGGFEMFGTSGMNQTLGVNCLAVVAGEITFSGTSDVNIDACRANGTQVAQVRYVRLVQ